MALPASRRAAQGARPTPSSGARRHKAWAEAIERNGWTPALLTGPAFDKFVDDEFASLRAIMAKSGMTDVTRAPQTLIGVGTLALGGGDGRSACRSVPRQATAASGPTSCRGSSRRCSPSAARGLVWESLSGGFRLMDEPSGAPRGHWPGFAWVSAGMLLNAALITTLGFILSCTLCFVLAVRGFRPRRAHPTSPRRCSSTRSSGRPSPPLCTGCSRNCWRSTCRA